MSNVSNKEIARRVADGLRRKHPDFDWQRLARILLPLYGVNPDEIQPDRPLSDPET